MYSRTGIVVPETPPAKPIRVRLEDGSETVAHPIVPKSFANDREPFERQPGESDIEWRAFQVYRDLEPSQRSLSNVRLAQVIEAGGFGDGWCLGASTLSTYVHTWRWRERVELFDRHQDNILRRELEGRRLRARVQAADLGQELRTRAAEAIAHLPATVTREVERGGKTVTMQVSALSPTQIIKLAEAGIKLERQALGENVGEGGAGTGMNLNLTFQNLQIGDEELLERAKNVIEARAECVAPAD